MKKEEPLCSLPTVLRENSRAAAALELLHQPEKLSSLRAAQTANFDGLAAQRVAEAVVNAVEQRQNL